MSEEFNEPPIDFSEVLNHSTATEKTTEDKPKTKKRRTVDEQLADLEQQAKQLAEKKKKLLAQKSSDERKKRTKRLIELGGAVCKVLNEDTIEGDALNDDDVANLIAFLKNQNSRGDFFTKAMHRTPKSNDNP